MWEDRVSFWWFRSSRIFSGVVADASSVLSVSVTYCRDTPTSVAISL